MEVLRQQARPVTLEELVTKRIDRDAKAAVAVTFDDGYANNLSVAKPVLERNGVPATVFVCSGYLERDREYWPSKSVRRSAGFESKETNAP